MNISSMTGFCRTGGHCEFDGNAFDWAFEMKSVNGRNFDFKVRLPQAFEGMSNDLKSVAQKYFERGSISVVLDIAGSNTSLQVKINRELLNKLAETAAELCASGDAIGLPTAGDLLAINGVVEIEKKSLDEVLIAKLQKELLAGFEQCCIGLLEDRRREGEKMTEVLKSLLEKIAATVQKIKVLSAQTPQHLREKLTRQIDEFLGANAGVSEERLAQEIVFLVNRADIREETDRLQAHLKTAEQLLSDGRSVGRRLDFLCQELNRETNTTCSKAADVEIVNLGMELKTTIEQLREQVQNME